MDFFPNEIWKIFKKLQHAVKVIKMPIPYFFIESLTGCFTINSINLLLNNKLPFLVKNKYILNSKKANIVQFLS